VVYASLDAAMAASRTIPTALFGQLINIQVIQGSETQYFPHCLFKTIRPNVQGCSVTYTMEAVTQMVTTVAPA